MSYDWKIIEMWSILMPIMIWNIHFGGRPPRMRASGKGPGPPGRISGGRGPGPCTGWGLGAGCGLGPGTRAMARARPAAGRRTMPGQGIENATMEVRT